MQIKAARIFIIILSLLPFELPGQESTYRAFAEKVTLDGLIDVLEKGYNVQFSYKSDLLQGESFFIKTNTPDLSAVLNEITALYPLEYQVLDDKSILLREKLNSAVKNKNKRIKVTVLDKDSKQPLESVAIGIAGTSQGNYTNEKGNTLISLSKKPEPVALDVHMLGYKNKKVEINGDSNIIIELTPQLFSIEEIMVQDRKDVITVDKQGHTITFKTNHIAATTSGILGKDIMRQAQLLPGVSSFNDISSGLQIRGSKEQASLIVVDDIPIYNASHYYGLFSSINPNYAVSSVLYKNNLPLSYDGKTAGMLMVNGLRADTTKQYQGGIDANLLTISGSIRLSFPDNWSLTIAGRTAYNNVSETDLFSLFNSPEEEDVIIENFNQSTRDKLLATVPDFSFFDINSKLEYYWESNKIAFNYFQSFDDLDDTFENTFLTRRERVVVRNIERYSNTEVWKNIGASFRIDLGLSDNLNLSTTSYYTNYDNQSGLDISIIRSFLNQSVEGGYDNNRGNTVEDIGIKSNLTFENTIFKLSTGIEVVNHDIGLHISELSETISARQKSQVETSAFVTFTPLTINNLNVDAGFRGTLYNESFYLSPRANASYQLSNEFSIKAAAGRHNQYVRKITFENIFGRNLDFWRLANDGEVKVSKSNNFMLGTTYKKGRWNIDVEAYYRKTINILELALVNPRPESTGILPVSPNNGNSYAFFNGDGSTIGIDFMVGITEKQYSGWLGYTLSKSNIEYDRIVVGTSFPAQDDRRHQIDWVNEYRVGNFTIGANFVFASGRPYTDLTKVVPSLRRDELNARDRISRLPDYIRTDLGVTYDFSIDQTDATLGLSAYNLLNRQNVNYVQYLFSITSNTVDQPSNSINTLLGTESNLLDRTVNLGISLKF